MQYEYSPEERLVQCYRWDGPVRTTLGVIARDVSTSEAAILVGILHLLGDRFLMVPSGEKL